MEYQCELSINNSKIVGFKTKLGLNVEGTARQQEVDFHVASFNHTTTFQEYMDYKIGNEELAQHMVTHSLNRLIRHRCFGSGWKLYPRDYPHFIVEDNYTIVYDSTHVDPNQELIMIDEE